MEQGTPSLILRVRGRREGHEIARTAPGEHTRSPFLGIRCSSPPPSRPLPCPPRLPSRLGFVRPGWPSLLLLQTATPPGCAGAVLGGGRGAHVVLPEGGGVFGREVDGLQPGRHLHAATKEMINPVVSSQPT